MAIEILGKRREALMFQSEAYKKIVREYLESQGYSAVTNSYHEGHLADLVLQRITEPNEELWVECKSTKISPSDRDLKKELLRYLIEMKAKNREKIKLALFAIGIKKQKEFNKILTKKYGPKLIPEWLSVALSEMKIDEQEKLTNIGQSEIIDFFLQMEVKIAEPEWLKRVTVENKKSNLLSTDRYVEELYTRSKRLSEPLNESVELITSLLEINHPEFIFRATTSKYKSKKSIYNYLKKQNSYTPPFTFFPEKKQVSSFCNFDNNNNLSKIIDKESISKVSIMKQEISPQNIHAVLNEHLRRIFWKRGLLRVPNKYIYYFPALENGGQINDREVEGVNGKKKKVVTVQRKNKDNNIHHIFHHAIEMSPQRLWNKTFLKLRPTKVFTEDGKTPIQGKKKTDLEQKYRNPLFNRNLAKLLETTFWHAVISNNNNFEMEKEYWFDLIKFGKLKTTNSPYRPKVQFDTDQTKLGEFK